MVVPQVGLPADPGILTVGIISYDGSGFRDVFQIVQPCEPLQPPALSCCYLFCSAVFQCLPPLEPHSANLATNFLSCFPRLQSRIA